MCLEWGEPDTVGLIHCHYINREQGHEGAKGFFFFFYDVIPKPLPTFTDLPLCIRQEVAAVVDTLRP